MKHLVNALCGDEINTQLDIVRRISKIAVRYSVDLLAQERADLDSTLSQFLIVGFSGKDLGHHDLSAFPDVRK